MRDKSFLFKGWYFKHTNNKNSLCFIPGLCPHEEKGFIQIINNDFSYVYDIPAKSFKIGRKSFFVRAENSIFSKKGIEINIKNKDICINGKIRYEKHAPLRATAYAPSIMGPFSYLNFMECYHEIISMSHSLNGSILVNGKRQDFTNGKGYIESDYGNSFPKRYIWVQSHDFKNVLSFMVAIAHIPMKLFSFTGVYAYFL